MKRILFITVLALLVAGAQAKVRKTSKAKAAKTEQKAKVDTVDVATFSYAMGAAEVNGLKAYLAQRLNVDTVNNMSDFVRGLQETLNKPKDKSLTAYSAGLQLGSQLMNEILTSLNHQITGKENAGYIQTEQYKQGFLSAVTGQDLKISVDSATKIVTKQMQYYKEQQMEQKYGQNRKDGEAFLAENAKKDSVKTLPSGVQYKILKEGNGPKPTETSTVKVHYEGRTIDGVVFDSSYKRNKPATFRVNQVIKGWTEALTQMPVGSTWMIYIPQELGYGAREAGNIKPFSTLIFKVELLEIVPEKPAGNATDTNAAGSANEMK